MIGTKESKQAKPSLVARGAKRGGGRRQHLGKTWQSSRSQASSRSDNGANGCGGGWQVVPRYVPVGTLKLWNPSKHWFNQSRWVEGVEGQPSIAKCNTLTLGDAVSTLNDSRFHAPICICMYLIKYLGRYALPVSVPKCQVLLLEACLKLNVPHPIKSPSNKKLRATLGPYIFETGRVCQSLLESGTEYRAHMSCYARSNKLLTRPCSHLTFNPSPAFGAIFSCLTLVALAVFPPSCRLDRRSSFYFFPSQFSSSIFLLFPLPKLFTIPFPFIIPLHRESS